MALKYLAIVFAVLASCKAYHMEDDWKLGSHGPSIGSGEQCGPQVLPHHTQEPTESAAGYTLKRNDCTYQPGSRINVVLSNEGNQPIEQLHLYARHEGDNTQHTVGSFKHCSWRTHLKTDNCIRRDDIITQMEPLMNNVQVTWVAPEKMFEQKPIYIVAVLKPANGEVVVIRTATILPEASQFLDSDESSSEESGSRKGKGRSRGGKSSKSRGGKSSKSRGGKSSRSKGDDRPPLPGSGMPAPAPVPPHMYPEEGPFDSDPEWPVPATAHAPGEYPHPPPDGHGHEWPAPAPAPWHGEYPHPPPDGGHGHGWPAPAPVDGDMLPPPGTDDDSREEHHDHGGEDYSDSAELMEMMEAMYQRHSRWEEHNQEQNMCPETATYLKAANAYWMDHDEEEDEDDYECWKMGVLIGIVILLMTVCGSVCYLAMKKRKMALKAQEEKPKIAYDNDIYSLSPENLKSDVKQPPVYTEVAEPTEKKVPLE